LIPSKKKREITKTIARDSERLKEEKRENKELREERGDC
jgi:hypothetical protein